MNELCTHMEYFRFFASENAEKVRILFVRGK